MSVEVKVPQLSESVSEATIVTWHKQVGDTIVRGENLVDIETDKVMIETPAPDAGVLDKIISPEGSSVQSGEIIAIISQDSSATGSGAKKKKSAKVAVKVEESAALASAEVPYAMPSARKIATEQQVDLSSISGSGRGGRVTKKDVTQQVMIPTAKVVPPPKIPALVEKALSGRNDTRVPMTRLRARIAERLLQSQAENAILTTFNEVNMSAVIALRKKYGEAFEKKYGTRLGFMSFFVKATLFALKNFPILNASVEGTDIVYHDYFDIGVAISSPRGLVVPILRDADQMSVFDIEATIIHYAQLGKEGKLTLDHLSGGTFSISNGGVFGSMLSTPIINPPQAAILGVHATKDRAVVENGQVVVRPMNYLALSYDHRIIDGRDAVLALVAMRDALEDPARLLLGV